MINARLIIETGAPSGPNARLLAVLAALESLPAEDEFPATEDGPPGAAPLCGLRHRLEREGQPMGANDLRTAGAHGSAGCRRA